MSNNGWVSIHRKIIDSPVFQDSQAVHLWLYILLSANHKEGKVMRGNNVIVIPRGSFLTGRKSLSKATNISESKIQRLLKLFEIEGQIEQQTNSQYRVITICNYDKHQDSEHQLNSKRTATEQQLNTNNKVNNDNKVNKKKRAVFAKPSKSEVSEYILSKGYSVNAESFINYYVSNGWMVGKTKMKDWKAAIRSWQTRETKTQPNQTTSPSWELGSK